MKRLLTYSFLIRVGLACVFLTNSLTAFLEPEEFSELVSNSYLVKILPVSVDSFVTFIGINDLVVAILLFIGWKISKVSSWAMLWVAGVISLLGVITLDSLEHLAFLLMAVALIVHGNNKDM